MNAGLLMLAGHAIYQDGQWHGGHQNEGRHYEQHVRDAFAILDQEGYQALALSGGHSRPHLLDITHSEAEGMHEYAAGAGLLRAGHTVLLEQLGRDSFENLFFSMLCFHRRFGEWPSQVGAVSWKFKALRFYLIACGLGLAEGRFRFYGSGDPSGHAAIEALATASAQYDGMIVDGGEIVDPLHRGSGCFTSKRLGRMPREFAGNRDYLRRVKQEYDAEFDAVTGQQGVVGRVIDCVESLEPGPAWREIAWPWSQSAR
jgi:hypothetical protein